MVILDANLILRVILNDQPEMSSHAISIIEEGNAYVTIEVMAEVVYVLNGIYKKNREDVAHVSLTFLKTVHSDVRDVLSQALHTYAKNNLDFVDCILFAYRKERGYEIATFDKKLSRLLDSIIRNS